MALVGGPLTGEAWAKALARSLEAMGGEALYLRHHRSAERIAAAVVAERAHAVEICLAGSGGVLLLRELADIRRRDVSIVVHRVR